MSDRYFEDYELGQRFVHRRGRTIWQSENVRWSMLTMNTAQAHWNVESLNAYMDGKFDRPLINAAIVIAMAVGLTSQHMSGQSVGSDTVNEIRIAKPMFGGDTLQAVSTVLALDDETARQDCGRLSYKIETHNQLGAPICSMTRSVLIKRRSYWREKDQAFIDAHWGTARP